VNDCAAFSAEGVMMRFVLDLVERFFGVEAEFVDEVVFGQVVKRAIDRNQVDVR
jgi:hypothetical protein